MLASLQACFSQVFFTQKQLESLPLKLKLDQTRPLIYLAPLLAPHCPLARFYLSDPLPLDCSDSSVLCTAPAPANVP